MTNDDQGELEKRGIRDKGARMNRFWEKALASLGASIGMIAIPMIYISIESLGPLGRVVYYPYIPVSLVGSLFVAGAIGASIGAEAWLWLRPRGPAYSVLLTARGCLFGAVIGMVAAVLAAVGLKRVGLSLPLSNAICFIIFVACSWAGGLLLFKAKDPIGAGRRRPWLRLAALAILIAWCIFPQFPTYPTSGTAAERDAWARKHVREYAALAKAVAQVPEVESDLGRVTQIAPTAHDRQIFATEMNGDDMKFTLEVVGEKGFGLFKADCTLDGDAVMEWRPSQWIFNGRTTVIRSAPGK